MTIDELRELGEPNVDNWHDADGEIDSLLVAKDKARADRELLAAARNHWDALLAIAEAAEAWRIASTSFDVNVATTESSRAFDLIRAVDKFKESIR